MDILSDSELYQMYLDGNVDAFECLYHRHIKYLQSVAKAIVRDPSTADDVVQSVMLRIHQSKCIAHGNVKAFLRRSVKNAAIDQLRNTQYHQKAIQSMVPFMRSIDQAVDFDTEKADNRKKVIKCFNTLLPSDRSIVQDRFYHKKSITDMANEAKVPVSTMKSRIRLSLKRFSEKYMDLDRP